ncbi:MAG: hypothetical protein R2729_23995 [Bryobacteraceae bacterium]
MRLLILAAATATAWAQGEGRAVLRTFGQMESNGTALYSVFAATRHEELKELLVAVALPPGARFLEQVHKPAGAVFDGVQKDVAYWSVPALEADTVLGPFVFRVKPDGSGEPLPSALRSSLAYQQPASELVEGLMTDGILAPLAAKGSITVDPRGTLDATGANAPVSIGETGATLFVPAGALDRATTITANRLNVDEHTLPETDPATWWCSLFQFEAEPRVTFSKPIHLALPSRRPIPPGVEILSAVTADLGDWGQKPEGGAARAAAPNGLGFGGFGTGPCLGGFGGFGCSFGAGFGFGGFGGFGISAQDNSASRMSGTAVSQALKTPSAAEAVTNPPGIIAILIGH